MAVIWVVCRHFCLASVCIMKVCILPLLRQHQWYIYLQKQKRKMVTSQTSMLEIHVPSWSTNCILMTLLMLPIFLTEDSEIDCLLWMLLPSVASLNHISKIQYRSGIPNPWDPANPILIPCKPEWSCDPSSWDAATPFCHVRFGVSNPWDPQVHSRYLVGMYDL